MNKKNGFTLIELLAVIVILGVIMIIAIPSVTNYITNSRKDSYVSDAKMFLDAAKTQLTADATLPQTSGEQVLIPISDIALDKGGEKSPFGNDWDIGKSYVVVENIGTSSDPEYAWKISLLDVKGNCIPLTNDSDLKREVVGTGCIIPSTLISKIIANGTTEDSSLNINEAPTELTSGVYVRTGTENNIHPIYYYRGIVTNNNVKFANFCWKIVRTTETGGIKLIYNGVPAADGSCNNTGDKSFIGKSAFNVNENDNAYIGYMYGTPGSSTYEETHANINDSTIKIVIDNWYANNMTSYTNKLEDTEWCNDRSLAIVSEGNGVDNSVLTKYGAYERLYDINNQPIFSCVNENDRFTVSTSNGNGKLTYPIGLLTSDEGILAGHGWYGYSASSYLHTGKIWWLGSPYYVDSSVAREFDINELAYEGGGKLSAVVGVRPAISLKSGALVTGGDGSVATPYVIE